MQISKGNFVPIKTVLGRLLAVACLIYIPAAQADFPEPGKPLRLIVGFPPGGGADVLARAISVDLAKQLGIAVVIENKPGASGIIATNTVARAAPDGHTVYLATPGSLTILPNMQDVPYDPAQDFTAISLLVSMPNVLVVSPNAGIASVAELLDQAKKGGDFTYASGGSGTIGQMAAEQFNLLANTQLRHVPYRGTTPALTDVMGGITTLTFSDPSVKNLVASGKLKALAVTGSQRSPQLPDVPTMVESGVAGYDLMNWYGVIGPKGMEPATLTRLNTAFNQAVSQPAVANQLAGAAAMEITTGSPAEFAALMDRERVKWADLIKRTQTQ